MGRKPTVHLSLPPRMRARRQKSGRVYYYFDLGGKPRREVALGDDYVLAVKKWTELQGAEPVSNVMFADVVASYVRDELPTKAPKTQHEYRLAIGRLLEFFDGAPLADIETQHVYQYGDRHRSHPVQAGRDKATLSAIFEFARRKGLTAANPCLGVKFKGSKARRTVYVSDDVMRAVYEAGDAALRDAMDLAYLTGQRPQDVLRFSEADIRDGALYVKQAKTGTPVGIQIVGRLAQVIARCKSRKKNHRVWTMALLTNEHGRPLTYTMLRTRFDAARAAAAKKHPKLAEQIAQFQFRDLRAKAGTDMGEKKGTVAAQRLLGHQRATTTDIYIRSRGVKVEPNK